MGVRIKICGVTSGEQARLVAELGVDAIGVNFVPESPRRVSEEGAREIVRAAGDRVLVVGVVGDLSVAELGGLRARTGVGCLQVHTDGGISRPWRRFRCRTRMPPAVRVGGPEDVARAERAPGE